jgi:drug/metabolite transporter (DMT)-like permease
MKTPSPVPTPLVDPPVPVRATSRRGIAVMVLSVLAFSVNTLLLRYIGREDGAGTIGPDVPLLFRAAVGTLMVLAFFRGGRPVSIAPVFLDRQLVVRGIVGLLGTAAYYWTIPSLGAGKATLVCNTYVIFASVFAMFSLGERLTLSRTLWLVLAFSGIVLLIGPNGAGAGFAFGFHEVVALGGAILAAWAVVLVRQLSFVYSIGTIYLAQCLWILAPVAVLAVPDLASLSAADTGLLVLAATAAGFGQLAMNEGYRCLTVTTGASLQMLWPVFATAGGWLLFEERFGALQWLGAALILASIWRIAAAGK